MNIQLIAEQIGRIHLTLETQDAFEVYGGTWLGSFEVSQTGTAQWTLTVREQVVAAAPLRDYKVYARQLATGREWEVLSGKILVSARTAAVPADKLAPVEYFVTVPVVDHDVDAVGSTIVQGIPGPQGPKGDSGPPGEGGMTEEERTTLAGAAQRDAANTFTASNTFTGSVDMSTAQVTPPSGWNVEGVTAEQVKAVVPIDWDGRLVLGKGCGVINAGVAVGLNNAGSYGNVVFGNGNKAGSWFSVILGSDTQTKGGGDFQIAIGNTVNSQQQGSSALAIAIGSQFAETTDSGNVTHSCTTEGTGSITIGAGANTLNNGSTESSNSVTIGCKALNQGADSVVIGASASAVYGGGVTIGAGATNSMNTTVVIGKKAKGNAQSGVVVGAFAASSKQSVSVGEGATSIIGSVSAGYHAQSFAEKCIALGYFSKAVAKNSVAIGLLANAADYGATVIRSTAEDGTYTQLYFSGANTPLANTYENGAPMLGYVTKDSAGNVVAAGTRSLIELLTNNSTFAPASLDENGEWVMPKVFHPSDLDMPTEEPQEPEEYQPLPVYPIVEPEILPPHGEIENS